MNANCSVTLHGYHFKLIFLLQKGHNYKYVYENKYQSITGRMSNTTMATISRKHIAIFIWYKSETNITKFYRYHRRHGNIENYI